MAKNIPQTKQTQQQSKQSSAAKQTAKVKSSGDNCLHFPTKENKELLFDKTNYLLFFAGVLLIIIGFILMSGGNTDPAVFNEAEIYSTRRITIAPITVIMGFLVIVLAILKKPTSLQNSEN